MSVHNAIFTPLLFPDIPVPMRDAYLRAHALLGALQTNHNNLNTLLNNQIHQSVVQTLAQDRLTTLVYTDNVEIGVLKRKLVVLQSEVDSCLKDEDEIQEEMVRVSDLKKDLSNDLEGQRRHIYELQEAKVNGARKEIKIELSQSKHLTGELRRDKGEREARTEGENKERDKSEMEVEKWKAIYQKSADIGAGVRKQNEILKDAILSLGDEFHRQSQIVAGLDRDIERSANKKRDVDELRIQQFVVFEKKREGIEARERELAQISVNHESIKDQTRVQKGERGRLESMGRAVVIEIRKQHDIVVRVIREKDLVLKFLRRLLTIVTNIQMSTPNTIKTGVELGRLLSTMKTDESIDRKTITILRQANDVQTLAFIKQGIIEKDQGLLWKQQIKLNSELEHTLNTGLRELTLITREVEEVKISRDMQLKNKMTKQTRIRTLKTDLLLAKSVQNENTKQLNESSHRVEQCMASFEQVKNERNKYLALIHTTSQRLSELVEKHGILNTETLSLRHELAGKDLSMNRLKQDYTTCFGVRDTLQTERNALLINLASFQTEIAHRLGKIATFNISLTVIESKMVEYKDKNGVTERERRQAVQTLLERDDEVCLLWDRVGGLTEMQQKENGKISLLDIDIQRLSLIKLSLIRTLKIQSKKPALIDTLQETLKTRLKTLQTLTKLQTALDHQLIPTANHITLLPDPVSAPNATLPLTLQLKTTSLLKSLSVLTSSILEKDLILTQLHTLVNRLSVEYETTKEKSNSILKAVSEGRRREELMRRKQMGLVVELGGWIEKVNRLRVERDEMAEVLKEGQEMVSNGDIPVDFALMQIKARRKNTNIEIWTNEKGERIERPNAYIPMDGELPIPKPYGEYSPFLPVNSNDAKRWYTKPVIKPIQFF